MDFFKGVFALPKKRKRAEKTLGTTAIGRKPKTRGRDANPSAA
jgi:hypothetical protein